MTEEPVQLDMNHVYLLGWYGPTGQAYLTTWSGGRPLIHVVVTGPIEMFGPPMWDAPATMRQGGHKAEEFVVHPIPDNEDPWVAAGRLRGVVAIGWYFTEGFERKWH